MGPWSVKKFMLNEMLGTFRKVVARLGLMVMNETGKSGVCFAQCGRNRDFRDCFSLHELHGRLLVFDIPPIYPLLSLFPRVGLVGREFRQCLARLDA